MYSEQRFEVPKWTQIYDMLVELSDKIRISGFNPDVLIGMSRGGWLPTRILSDLLENPHIASVGVEFYVGVNETNAEPRLTQPLSINVCGKKVLLIDDVVDTGKSAMLTRTHIDSEGAKETKTESSSVDEQPVLSADTRDYLQEKETKSLSIDGQLQKVEKGMIVEALKKTGGVQVKAAELLGINQRSLWHRIKKHNIDVGSFTNLKRENEG